MSVSASRRDNSERPLHEGPAGAFVGPAEPGSAARIAAWHRPGRVTARVPRGRVEVASPSGGRTVCRMGGRIVVFGATGYT
jgi:hypothetical protein